MSRRIRGVAILVAVLAVVPLHGTAAEPAGPSFRLDPPQVAIQGAAGVIAFGEVTLTNVTPFPLVVPNSATFSGPGADKFSDTQAGSCWQSYGALGQPIPGRTSCTIQVSFLSATAGTFSATMTVTRCTDWEIDPDFGFIVCTGLDGSRSIRVSGTATPAPTTTRHIYLGDGDGIGRASLDGTFQEHFLVVYVVGGIAVTLSHLYWNNLGQPADPTGTIGRAGIDGANINESLITLPENWVPTDVAVNASHVYWVARERAVDSGYQPIGRIGRASLDGTGVEHALIVGLDRPFRLAVDATHIYWSSDSPAIGRANADGSGPDQSFISGIAHPGDIAVDDGHIYWKRATGIARSNLDGSAVNENFITHPSVDFDHPWGLDVDSSKIYFSLNLHVYTADLDGSNVTGFFDLFAESGSIAVDPE